MAAVRSDFGIGSIADTFGVDEGLGSAAAHCPYHAVAGKTE
jgi:hypothetical protein